MLSLPGAHEVPGPFSEMTKVEATERRVYNVNKGSAHRQRSLRPPWGCLLVWRLCPLAIGNAAAASGGGGASG